MSGLDGKKMRRCCRLGLFFVEEASGRKGCPCLLEIALYCIACSNGNELEAGGYAAVEMLLATAR